MYRKTHIISLAAELHPDSAERADKAPLDPSSRTRRGLLAREVVRALSHFSFRPWLKIVAISHAIRNIHQMINL